MARGRALGVVSAVAGAVALVLVVAAVVVALSPRQDAPAPATAVRPTPTPSPAPDNPFAGVELYVSPDSSAARAAADDPTFAGLASTPTAVWIVPEVHPVEEVAGYLAALGADADGRLPVIVLYGIPGRDCGSFSAGGLDAGTYPAWIAAVADGLAGYASAVILEPDALALSASCDSQDAAAALLRDAVGVLAANPRTAVYLDAGNSNWLPPAQMAPLLVAAGVGSARGFATNVSNYNTTADERAYAEALSALVGGAHYVVDTSRNGNGSTGEWCNPSGRALGAAPVAVDDGSAQDAGLWIKIPGESDGECNGGPPAGAWWDTMARELIANAG